MSEQHCFSDFMIPSDICLKKKLDRQQHVGNLLFTLIIYQTGLCVRAAIVKSLSKSPLLVFPELSESIVNM